MYEKVNEFVIKGEFYKKKCFPGFNELIGKAKKHFINYSDMKAEYELIAKCKMHKELKRWKAKADIPIKLKYTFGEPKTGQKRDFSNVESAAKKIIEDAMIDGGIIVDDDPKHLLPSFESEFVYVSGTPFIKVEIYEKA